MKYPRFTSLSPSSRSASSCKARTKGKNTKPERLLRTALYKRGLRFQKHVGEVVGVPDIVFKRLRVAIFVDGDFWHGRNWRSRQRRLANGTNSSYWIAKIAANMRRDRQVSRALRDSGWRVLRFWESDVARSLDSVARSISSLIERRRARAVIADVDSSASCAPSVARFRVRQIRSKSHSQR